MDAFYYKDKRDGKIFIGAFDEYGTFVVSHGENINRWWRKEYKTRFENADTKTAVENIFKEMKKGNWSRSKKNRFQGYGWENI